MIFERLKFFFFFFNKKNFNKNNIFLCIKNRNFLIAEKQIGLRLALHNGKFFIPFLINDNMLKNMFGAFSFTRKILLKKKVKERKKKK